MLRQDSQYIIKNLLQSILDIISRRTSENYSAIVMSKVIKNLEKKHEFLKNIEIKNPQTSETFDIINIKGDFNNIEEIELKNSTMDLINYLSETLGREAGYYFIKEIKDSIPSDQEEIYKNLGIDFNVLQLEFINKRKDKYRSEIKNSEVMNHAFKNLFETMEKDLGRDLAFSTLDELINRFSTKYEALKKIKLNDIRTVTNTEIISTSDEIDNIEIFRIGEILQKIIQECNNTLNEKGNMDFIDNFQAKLNPDIVEKLIEMGVNLNTIQLKQGPIVKYLIKSLIQVLSNISSKNYAILTLDAELKEITKKYSALRYINIDDSKYSEGYNAISISPDINIASTAEVGKGLQKLIEKITKSLGEEAGRIFLNKLKKQIGRAYMLRIEELGVNLYMIELKYSMMW